MDKLFIKNRKGQNLAVRVEQSGDQKGLALIMHGLGGFKEQPHLQVVAEAFLAKGYTVIRFDTTNTLGESDGSYEKATTTNYYEDLEDVIQWAKKQAWYQEPFVLVGHSLGGFCTAFYAENHPKEILALAPISILVSGKLSLEAHQRFEPEGLKNWEKTGWQITRSRSKPGMIKKLPWSHMIDRLKYDLLPQASRLTMPILLIIGENDTATPPDQVKILFRILPGPKEFHLIKGAPHTFRAPEHLEEIRRIFLDWINQI